MSRERWRRSGETCKTKGFQVPKDQPPLPSTCAEASEVKEASQERRHSGSKEAGYETSEIVERGISEGWI